MKNILSLFITLLLNSTISFAHTLNLDIDFDINYNISMPSSYPSTQIHVDLNTITETEETNDYTIYYLEYSPTGKDLYVHAYFENDVDYSIASVYYTNDEQVAIKIEKVSSPPNTLEGAILFILRDDIIKPMDTNIYIDNSLDELVSTEVEELIEKEIAVYPNPANQIIYIKNVEKIQSIRLTNLLSNQTNIIHTNQPTITVQDWAEGIYMLQIQDENNIWHKQKIMIKH